MGIASGYLSSYRSYSKVGMPQKRGQPYNHSQRHGVNHTQSHTNSMKNQNSHKPNFKHGVEIPFGQQYHRGAQAVYSSQMYYPAFSGISLPYQQYPTGFVRYNYSPGVAYRGMHHRNHPPATYQSGTNYTNYANYAKNDRLYHGNASSATRQRQARGHLNDHNGQIIGRGGFDDPGDSES